MTPAIATSEAFTPDGQFVSRYFLETLVARDEHYGLDLQGDVPNWTIDAATMRIVSRWLHDKVSPSVLTWDEEQEGKRDLVRDRLSELLPGHSITPQGNSISIEAAADLLDIIEGLKAEVENLTGLVYAHVELVDGRDATIEALRAEVHTESPYHFPGTE